MESILPFNSDRFKDKWIEWLTYRKESRFKPYTPTGFKNTCARLVRLSRGDEWAAIKIIEQSMENSWRGLFAIKNEHHGGINQNVPKPGTSTDRIRTARDW